MKTSSAILILFSLTLSVACHDGADLDIGDSIVGPNGSSPMGGASNSAGIATNVGGVDLSQGTVTDYPKTEFFGTGTLASIDPNNPIAVRTAQDLSAETIISRTISFTSSDRTINDRVKGNAGSAATYNRANKNETYSDPGFLMYAKTASTTGSKTRQFRFSRPFPVLVIPTDRYQDLPSKPYTVLVKANSNVEGDFDINVTISATPIQGDFINITQVNEINDPLGKIYDAFPLPRTATYKIDMKNKKVMGLDTETYYFNSHLNQRKSMNVDFKLCSYTVKDQTQTYGCQ